MCVCQHGFIFHCSSVGRREGCKVSLCFLGHFSAIGKYFPISNPFTSTNANKKKQKRTTCCVVPFNGNKKNAPHVCACGKKNTFVSMFVTICPACLLPRLLNLAQRLACCVACTRWIPSRFDFDLPPPLSLQCPSNPSRVCFEPRNCGYDTVG